MATQLPIPTAESYSAAADDFFVRQKEYIEYLGRTTDKCFDVNKQIASFSERILLIALGTLGVSVTTLISVSGKFSNLAAKKAFLHYVLPAWILLLLSVFTARNVMILTIKLNAKLLNDLRLSGDKYNVLTISRHLFKLTRHWENLPDGQFKTLLKNMDDVRIRLQNDMEKLVNPPNKIEIISRAVTVQAQVAVWAMQVAFVLLGIGAVKLLLWF